MPAVARMEKMTVMGRATVTSCSNGMPSYGVRPPKDHQMKSGSDQCPIQKEHNHIRSSGSPTLRVTYPAIISPLVLEGSL